MESTSKIRHTLKKDIVIGGHSAPIYALSNADSHSFYSGSGDRFLAKWNLKTGLQDKFSIQLDSAVYCIHHLPEKHLLFIGLNNGNLHVIDTEAKQEIKLLKMSNASVFTITSCPNQEYLFATSADSKMGIWKIPSLENVQMIQFASGKIRSTLVRDNHIILGCQTGEIRIIDYINIQEVNRFQAHEDSVNCLDWHDEKNLLISGGKDAFIRFFNADSGEEILSVPAHNFSVYGILKIKDLILSCSMDKFVKVWDAQSMELIDKFDFHNGGHKRSVNAMTYCADQNRVLTTGDDQTIISWEITPVSNNHE